MIFICLKSVDTVKAAQAEIKRKENKQWENMEHTEALIPSEQSIRKIIRW